MGGEMDFQTVDEILGFAIEREQEAHDLYATLADSVRRPGMREAFLDFAREEAGHKAKLIGIREGKLPEFETEKIQDLKLGELLEGLQPTPGMNYQQALQLAIKAEQRAHELYTGLAAATADAALRSVFEGLAQEETKHKLRFETEYDEVVLEGN
jgi:rubrerythrin